MSAAGPEVDGGAGRTPVEGADAVVTRAWALRQVAKVLLLGALLLLAMREADLDARSLEERKARSRLVQALENRASGGPAAVASVARLEDVYRAACGRCAAAPTCDESLRAIRQGQGAETAEGPCRRGLLGRWGPGGAPSAGR